MRWLRKVFARLRPAPDALVNRAHDNHRRPLPWREPLPDTKTELAHARAKDTELQGRRDDIRDRARKVVPDLFEEYERTERYIRGHQ